MSVDLSCTHFRWHCLFKTQTGRRNWKFQTPLSTLLSSLLPSIHWAGKIRKSYHNAAKNEGHQHETNWNHQSGPSSSFTLTYISWNRDTKIPSHDNPQDRTTCAQSATHSYVTQSTQRPCVHQQILNKFEHTECGGRRMAGGGTNPSPPADKCHPGIIFPTKYTCIQTT